MKRYIKTKLATDWPEKRDWKERLINLLFFFIRANANYGRVMHLLDEWLVEIDKNNMPWREVGLDKNGEPILAGPSKANYGFWSDTNITGSDFSDASEISQDFFEEKWAAFWENCDFDQQLDNYDLLSSTENTN